MSEFRRMCVERMEGRKDGAPPCELVGSVVLTEEVSDVEAVPAGPVVVGLLAGRRLPPTPRLAADGDHLWLRRRRGDDGEEGASDSNNAELHDAGHGFVESM